MFLICTPSLHHYKQKLSQFLATHMHVPTDVLEQTQTGSAAMAMLQEKVGHVFSLAEL